MFVCELSFQPCSVTYKARQRFEDLVENLIAPLLGNGQVCGDTHAYWSEDQFKVLCKCPRQDSLDVKYLSEGGKRSYAAVLKECRKRPTWRLLSDPVPRRGYASWRRSKSLYLFTTFLSDHPPVRSGRDGTPIPSYLLPLRDFSKDHPSYLKDELYGWASQYGTFDETWIASGALEIAAYRQLADPRSKFVREGRELAAKVEEATGLPTYSYLMRYYGRRRGERRRPCPGCGRPWARRLTDPKFQGLGGFDFRCDPCRLISRVAADDTNEQYAHIGEYRRRTSSRRRSTR